MELKKYSDIEVLELIAESNILGLEELYNRYSKILFTLINKICNEQAIAEQILRQIFISIIKKAKNFPFNTENSYAWLILFARNRAVDSLRRNRTSEQIYVQYNDDFENRYIMPILTDKGDPIDFETANKISNDLYNAYYKLTDVQRTVIELAFYDGYTVNEIAAKLKIPIETVRYKLMAGIFSLRDKLMQIETKENEGDNLVSEFISAFSLGCLERKNFDIFVDYLNAGKLNNIQLELLGVIQNVVSLIPLSLEPISPDNNLFKKIKSDIELLGIPFTDRLPEKEDPLKMVQNETTENKDTDIENESVINKSDNNITDVKEINIIKDEIINEDKVLDNKNNSKFISGFKSKHKILFYGSLVLSGLLLIFLVVVSYNSSSTINNLENRLELAEEKASKSFDFVKEYQTYIDFTNQGNFKVIQLKDTSGFIAARLFLSLTSDEGLIQIDNLPKIQSDEEYSLQAVKSGISRRLITFLVSDNNKYLWIKGKNNLQLIQSDLFKILIHKKSKKQEEGTPIFWGN
ncbi:MAG TPA: sigma-70 family RNA polymerase sigma factor [Melioribacteraceae bacterium]|nr:sigma-70 family RNA polymerase sigma factor [Melioribacteraceae bacterium]